ncbi:hypothetical protein ANN_20895 [Periplaneta americana]|uniref:Uncharacterized protein n=1 Tax=Periplaneta americana TaxID=6978 RepID=A0ABQ8SF55_PERAM|nr:hypothetical protein ANN_20895 [Periplaneta americana]
MCSANRGKTQLQFNLSNGDQDEESDFDGDVENNAPCLYCNEFYSQYKPEETWLQDEVTGEWRKLRNAELHALDSSPDIIRNIKSRRLRWTGHVARMSESRNAYRVLVGRPEGKRPLGRPRHRWEDNIKMDLREMERIFVILLASCLIVKVTAQQPENYPDLGFCSSVRCINISEKDCPATFTPAQPEKDICCNSCVVMRRKGESCGNLRFLFDVECEKPYTCKNEVCSQFTPYVTCSSLSYFLSSLITVPYRHSFSSPPVPQLYLLPPNLVLHQVSQSKQASLVYRSSTRVCVRNCVSIRRSEFECSGPQLEGPEFECSGPQLEGPEFEYSGLSLKVCGSRYCELE